jgi:NRAMP (natural resistance-associated macrophage protein)-like metal ion transporter
LAQTIWRRLSLHPLASLGPGLITGVADDDPSGIATYSQAGARFGLDMLWTMPLSFPLMGALQSMCARIGRVTGKGLAANIKEAFPPIVLKGVVFALLAANILNIAADIAAIGEVSELSTGLDRRVATILLVVGSVILQVLVPYHRYVLYLKWLTLSLLAYAAVLFVVPVPWSDVAARTLLPHIRWNAEAATMVVAIFGTTISPYLFFWQASEEVEDMMRRNHARPLVSAPAKARAELGRIGWDTWSGMLYSNLAAYFIILATAVTLNAAGITNIETAAQAAGALRPLAGDFAFILFSLGIFGVGLIGIPVLAGSGAYACAEAMGWKWGLERRATDARGFYGVIAASVVTGLVIQFLPISPMKALFWSAVINGIVAVPLMAVIIVLASRRSVMGAFVAKRPTIVLGWVATAIMAAAALQMFLPG